MTRFDRLKYEGKCATKWRGHNISPFHTVKHQLTAEASCRKCGMTVWVNTKPAPNEIDISGEAVALHCRFQ
jgi:hypothetical protein